jgi:hypothetical protein
VIKLVPRAYSCELSAYKVPPFNAKDSNNKYMVSRSLVAFEDAFERGAEEVAGGSAGAAVSGASDLRSAVGAGAVPASAAASAASAASAAAKRKSSKSTELNEFTSDTVYQHAHTSSSSSPSSSSVNAPPPAHVASPAAQPVGDSIAPRHAASFPALSALGLSSAAATAGAAFTPAAAVPPSLRSPPLPPSPTAAYSPSKRSQLLDTPVEAAPEGAATAPARLSASSSSSFDANTAYDVTLPHFSPTAACTCQCHCCATQERHLRPAFSTPPALPSPPTALPSSSSLSSASASASTKADIAAAAPTSPLDLPIVSSHHATSFQSAPAPTLSAAPAPSTLAMRRHRTEPMPHAASFSSLSGAVVSYQEVLAQNIGSSSCNADADPRVVVDAAAVAAAEADVYGEAGALSDDEVLAGSSGRASRSSSSASVSSLAAGTNATLGHARSAIGGDGSAASSSTLPVSSGGVAGGRASPSVCASPLLSAQRSSVRSVSPVLTATAATPAASLYGAYAPTVITAENARSSVAVVQRIRLLPKSTRRASIAHS